MTETTKAPKPVGRLEGGLLSILKFIIPGKEVICKKDPEDDKSDTDDDAYAPSDTDDSDCSEEEKINVRPNQPLEEAEEHEEPPKA